jgi:glucan phosphoethanolaminetransferase (alkaline phosphatase superfamily)
MDVIIDYIKRLDVIMGLLIIVSAIIIGVFKQYQFIAGLNTKSSKELAKIDLDYVTKYFGIFFGILGLFMVLSPLLYDCFNVTQEVRNKITPIVIISIVVFILLYLNVFKRKRVYKKDERD